VHKNQQIILSTINTPEVILDPTGKIKLTGRLISENPMDFFTPIEKWINEYFYNPAKITYIEISLEYINSVGTKFLINIMNEITHIQLRKNKEKFEINWYYEDIDEDMLEKGTFLSMALEIPFNFIRII